MTREVVLAWTLISLYKETKRLESIRMTFNHIFDYLR